MEFEFQRFCASRTLVMMSVVPGLPLEARGAPDEILVQNELQAWQPPEDIVVVHGDATLANLLIDRDGGVGFVDCGNGILKKLIFTADESDMRAVSAGRSS